MPPNVTSLPRIVLGTAIFAKEKAETLDTSEIVLGVENAKALVDTFRSYGHRDIDSARVYGKGEAEQVLGELDLKDFSVSTKIYAAVSGKHDALNLERSLRETLLARKTDKVDIMYLHAPDRSTPFEVTVKAVDGLYRQGLFERYNPIARSVEHELLPCLKRYDIAFNAYNVIAGGLLTGMYKTVDEIIEGSRYDPKVTFAMEWTPFGNYFREKYWNKFNLDAVQVLTAAVTANKLTLIEATLRWMRHHSGLEAKDGIIIGVNEVTQLEQNLQYLERGPLPQPMVDAFNTAWRLAMPGSKHYVDCTT
ncbi:hypothetical protein BGZ72_007835 [Mortierella alpina]|nr:hypothetical protein BGZ72_007835 [Mortierella alpina]